MSSFQSSSIGLPNQLKDDLPPSLSDSARSYSVNVSPDGITSVNSAFPSTLFHVLPNAPIQNSFTSQ